MILKMKKTTYKQTCLIQYSPPQKLMQMKCDNKNSLSHHSKLHVF